ncbi:MAG: hypothetical protein KatS3mg027_1005 [Bacteroidia bacterium]|nr:MAG: hypothetical protein KatS3mg027_1005 [Bacteroidia bacterium]
MIRRSFIVLLIILKFGFSQNQKKLDSLFTELKKWESKSGTEADTNVYNCYYNLGLEYHYSNIDSANYFFNQSISKAKQIRDPIRELYSVTQIGWSFFLIGEYQKALEIFNNVVRNLQQIDGKVPKKERLYAGVIANIATIHWNLGDLVKALEMFNFTKQQYEKIGNMYDQCAVDYNIATLYIELAKYDKALEFLFKSLKISQKINYKEVEASCLENIGIVFYEQEQYNKSLKYFFNALKTNEQINNLAGISNNYCNIGNCYDQLNQKKLSLNYYFKALKINEKLQDKKKLGKTLTNIGILYKTIGDSMISYGNHTDAIKNHSKALEYLNKSYYLNSEIGQIRSKAICLSTMASIYLIQKKYKLAETLLIQAKNISESIYNHYHLVENYLILYTLYAQTGRYKEALEAYKKHVMHKDSVNSEENKKALATKEMQYLFEKKQAEEQAKHEQELLRREAKEKQQQLYLYLTGSVSLAILIILGIVFKSLQTTKRQKKIIEQARDEIAAQKKIVEEKNKDILDSITYAKRIQQAILPHPNKWEQLLPDSFILYLPKDIVAGDFYWLEETDQYIFVAACDCTGHGVPGAMVSVVCSNALTRAVLEEKLTETNQILNRVREIVIEKLSGSDENIRDGMDVCLVRINKQNRKQIQYSGANRPLYIAENNILIEIKPDKQPIGKYEEAKPFSSQQIELNENALLYLTTDGYADQFGGEKGKKIGTKQFKELLSSLVNKAIEEQYTALETFYLQWRGEGYQTDDVTLLGVKI